MDNLRGLLGIRRRDKVPNVWIRELGGMTRRVDERIDEGVLLWFAHVERMENDGIVKRGSWECVGSPSVGRTRKRWPDICKVWMTGKKRERCMIEGNSGGF